MQVSELQTALFRVTHALMRHAGAPRERCLQWLAHALAANRDRAKQHVDAAAVCGDAFAVNLR